MGHGDVWKLQYILTYSYQAYRDVQWSPGRSPQVKLEEENPMDVGGYICRFAKSHPGYNRHQQDDITPPKCSFFGTFEHFELSPPTSLQIYAQALEPPVFQSLGLMSSGYESLWKNTDDFERNKTRKFQPSVFWWSMLSPRASSSQLKCHFNLSIITWRERSELISWSSASES